MAKSTFQQDFTNIIVFNKYQSALLRLANLFIIELAFRPFLIISDFPPLETLIINDIESNIVNLLISSIHIIHDCFDGDFYRQIFR